MKHNSQEPQFLSWIVLAVCLLFVCSCKSSKPFHVNVNAEEPIKLDLSMDIHVYNHAGKESDEGKKSSKSSAKSAEKDKEIEKYTKVLESRRNRMAEVQEMKNARYVGENHLGLLELRSLPDGSAGDWVKKTVSAENDDRKFLMDHEADSKSKELAKVRAEQRQHILRKSHVGEWIEVDDLDNPGSYKWIEKVSPKKAASAELPDVDPVTKVSGSE